MFDILDRLRRSATIALIISPAGILIIAATRLLIISDYNVTTAAAILTSSGYINTLLGTVLPVVQVFMPYLVLVLLFFRRFILSLLAALAAALISPTVFSRAMDAAIARSDLHAIENWISHNWWIYPILAIAVICMLLEISGYGFSEFMRTAGAVSSLALVLYVLRVYPFPLTHSYYSSLIREPWLPAETFSLSSHRQVVGYNLSSGGVWLEVLIAGGRTIEFYPDSSIEQQQICQLGASTVQLPLISLAPAVVRLPQCIQVASAPAMTGGVSPASRARP
jgi:hypothetical protein